MVKRINHNDLLPWFLEDHGQLPASYLKSTQKFFDGLQVTSYKLPGPRSISNANKGLIHKRQASSSKRQAFATIEKYNKKEKGII